VKKHSNPYRIKDPTNIFEVSENSSHPELYDKRRIWKYKGKVFKTATECQRYLEDEGINWRRLKLVPIRHLDGDGSCVIMCNVVERTAGDPDIRDLERMARNG
jgi:hypothetical protein